MLVICNLEYLLFPENVRICTLPPYVPSRTIGSSSPEDYHHDPSLHSVHALVLPRLQVQATRNVSRLRVSRRRTERATPSSIAYLLRCNEYGRSECTVSLSSVVLPLDQDTTTARSYSQQSMVSAFASAIGAPKRTLVSVKWSTTSWCRSGVLDLGRSRSFMETARNFASISCGRDEKME